MAEDKEAFIGIDVAKLRNAVAIAGERFTKAMAGSGSTARPYTEFLTVAPPIAARPSASASHASRGADRFQALEPVKQAVRQWHGGFATGIAAGLRLRHDHSSQYVSHVTAGEALGSPAHAGMDPRGMFRYVDAQSAPPLTRGHRPAGRESIQVRGGTVGSSAKWRLDRSCGTLIRGKCVQWETAT